MFSASRVAHCYAKAPGGPRVQGLQRRRYENAHPADIAEEKYQYLNRLAASVARCIGPVVYESVKGAEV